MIAGARRVAGAYEHGDPVIALVRGDPQPSDVWDARPTLSDGGLRVFDLGDLRAMARMRHTGVPYRDLATIFDVTTSEARRYVWLYAMIALGRTEQLLRRLPTGSGMRGAHGCA